eukprot:g46255.t1
MQGQQTFRPRLQYCASYVISENYPFSCSTFYSPGISVLLPKHGTFGPSLILIYNGLPQHIVLPRCPHLRGTGNHCYIQSAVAVSVLPGLDAVLPTTSLSSPQPLLSPVYHEHKGDNYEQRLATRLEAGQVDDDADGLGSAAGSAAGGPGLDDAGNVDAASTVALGEDGGRAEVSGVALDDDEDEKALEGAAGGFLVCGVVGCFLVAAFGWGCCLLAAFFAGGCCLQPSSLGAPCWQR